MIVMGFAPYQLTAQMGALINVTISNNHFVYSGSNTPGVIANNNVMSFAGLLNLHIVNNTITMNSLAATGFAIYLEQSGNVNICNNTITGSPALAGPIYVDTSSTVNVTQCGGAPYVPASPALMGDYAWNLPFTSSGMRDVSMYNRLASANAAPCSPVFGVFGGLQSMHVPCTALAVSVPYAALPVSYTVQVWMMMDNNATMGDNYWIAGVDSAMAWNSLLLTQPGASPYVGFPNPVSVYSYAYQLPAGNPQGWHQYAFTFDAHTSLYTVYVDGVVVQSVTSSSVTAAWSTTFPLPTLVLGSTLNPMYFHDFIGWNGVRSPQQLAYDYACGQGSNGTGTAACSGSGNGN